MANEPALPQSLLSAIRRARRVLLLTHHNPDGDAVGSSVALAQALTALGARVEAAFTGSWPENLSHLVKGLDLIPLPGDFAAYDLILLLDCHAFARMGAQAPADSPPVAVIDHHPLDAGEEAGEAWFVRPKASSTGELVWRLLADLKAPLSPLAVEALLTALVSDTGFFTQRNTTPGALRAGADLLERGGSLEKVHTRLRRNLPLRRLKLMGLVLDSLRLHCGGRLALMTATPAFLRASGALMSDTEEFVELGRNLAGVLLSVLIKDDGRRVRVSLRSREPVDASALAALFGGGGHKQAAAYDDAAAADAEEAAARLLARAESFL